MSQRIRFQRMYGENLGYVDLKGTTLHSSNSITQDLIDSWLKGFRGPKDEAGQAFIDFYASYSRGHLNSMLVDSEADSLKDDPGE